MILLDGILGISKWSWYVHDLLVCIFLSIVSPEDKSKGPKNPVVLTIALILVVCWFVGPFIMCVRRKKTTTRTLGVRVVVVRP